MPAGLGGSLPRLRDLGHSGPKAGQPLSHIQWEATR